MAKFSTKHSMPEETRDKIIGILQLQLVDSIDLQLQSKVAHWNVKGPRFFTLHQLFDEVYTNLTPVIDETAERVATLGELTDANIQAVSSRTRLNAYPTDITKGLEHADALSDALATFAKNTKEAIDLAADLGDVGTEDMLTGHLRTVEQYLWFVEAHLQDDAISPGDIQFSSSAAKR